MDALIGFANRSVRMAKNRLKEIEDKWELEQQAIYQGPFFINTVHIIETNTINGITYYRFEVTRKDDKPPFIVDLRYSDLAKAKDRMWTNPRDRAEVFLNPQYEFPPKNINSHAVHIYHMDMDEIQERRRGLELWVQERVTFVHKRDRDPAWVQQHRLHAAIARIENELNKAFRVHEHVAGYSYHDPGPAEAMDSSIGRSGLYSHESDRFVAGAYGGYNGRNFTRSSTNFGNDSYSEQRPQQGQDGHDDCDGSGAYGSYGSFGERGRRNSISGFLSRRRLSFSAAPRQRMSFSQGVSVSADGNTIRFVDDSHNNTYDDGEDGYTAGANSAISSSSRFGQDDDWAPAVVGAADASAPPATPPLATSRYNWRAPPALATYNATVSGVGGDGGSISSSMRQTSSAVAPPAPVFAAASTVRPPVPPAVAYQQQLERQQRDQQKQQQAPGLIRRSTYAGNSSLSGPEAFV